MKRRLFKLVLLPLALALSGCASTGETVIDSRGDQEDPLRIPAPEYSGHLEFGYEVSAFTECGASEVWWIASGKALQPLNDFIDHQSVFTDDQGFVQGRVFVRWRGLVSAPGRYGHWGGYVRQFRVVEVLEVRMPSSGDCNCKG